MSIPEVLNYVAWAVSIILIAWMVIDALRVEVTYDRDLLVSSIEGEIEKEILSHDEAAVLRSHAAAAAVTESEIDQEATSAHRPKEDPDGD
jgi:hypothetical protein